MTRVHYVTASSNNPPNGGSTWHFQVPLRFAGEDVELQLRLLEGSQATVT